MAAVAPDHLLVQLIRLSRAQFDMRCARDLTFDLEQVHDNISSRAYGLLAGVAISYARPFTDARPYGQLEARWSRFAERPEFGITHERLLDVRRTLLAHNDVSPHRVTLVLPEWMDGKPAVTEGRSPIDAAGVDLARELFELQHDRFGLEVQRLAGELQGMLGWSAGAEINLDEELQRLRAKPEQ